MEKNLCLIEGAEAFKHGHCQLRVAVSGGSGGRHKAEGTYRYSQRKYKRREFSLHGVSSFQVDLICPERIHRLQSGGFNSRIQAEGDADNDGKNS